MVDFKYNCTKCAVDEKMCRLENGRGPVWCPTKRENESCTEALKKCDDMDLKEFVRLTSIQEGSFYARRDAEIFWP